MPFGEDYYNQKNGLITFLATAKKENRFFSLERQVLEKPQKVSGSCLTGKNISSEPLDLLKIEFFVLFSFFFFLEKPKPQEREKEGKNEKQEEYFFLLDSETEMTGMVLSVPWQVPSAGPQKHKQERRRQGEKSMPFLQQGLEDGFTPTLLDGLICSNCEYYIIQLQRLNEQLFIILGLSLTGSTALTKKFIRVDSLRRAPERPFWPTPRNGKIIPSSFLLCVEGRVMWLH